MINNYYDQKQNKTKQKANFVLKKNGNYDLNFLQQNNQLIIIDISIKKKIIIDMFLFLIIVLLDFTFKCFFFLELIKFSNTLCVINIIKRKFGF